MKNEKNRNWTFLVYPDSAPENWQSILQDTGLPYAISPLHNKDLNPTGEQKKPHYHVIVCFPGPTTFNKVNSDICALLNSPIPKRLLSVVGMYRYFTHKDNPDKYQYSDTEIVVSNGFDIKEYDILTSSQVILLMKELILIIKNKKFTEYCQLIDYLIIEDCTDLFQVASSHTLFFDRYVSSKRNLIKEIKQEIIDKKYYK